MQSNSNSNQFINDLKKAIISKSLPDVQSVIQTAPHQLEELTDEQKVEAFLLADRDEALDIFKYLDQAIPSFFSELTYDSLASLLDNAVRQGAMIRYKIKGFDEIKDFDEVHYRYPSKAIQVLEYIKQKVSSDLLREVIRGQNNNFHCYWWAVRDGTLDELLFMEKMIPDQLQELMKHDNYRAFREAVEIGRRDICEHILDVLQGVDVATLTKALYDYEFSCLFRYGSLSCLQFLLEKAPEETLERIHQLTLDDFVETILNGQSNVLDLLEQIAPEIYKAYISEYSRNFPRYLEVIQKGYLPGLLYLEKKVPGQLKSCIAYYDYKLFFTAVEKNRDDFANYLLFSFNEVFRHAEPHKEFETVIKKFIKQQLENLYTQKQHTECEDKQTRFDVDQQTAERCFFILRNLIHRKNDDDVKHIDFLLSIPAVNKLATYDSYMEEQTNELLCEARYVHNIKAIEILMNIPDVFILAIKNNNYEEKMDGIVTDFRPIVKDTNSAMRTLSPGERSRLERVLTRYNPELHGGAKAVINSLRKKLEERFINAKLKIAGVYRNGGLMEVDLPLNYEAFFRLFLVGYQRKYVLEMYYLNNDHTALRFLSDHNWWLHPDAKNVSTGIGGNRKSFFEEYETMIAAFYLAAIDTDEEMATDGYTPETRLDYFIHQLAYCGRAHNWEYRYDDLKADQPDCPGGLKRNLFESLLGHPILKILPIHWEIIEFSKKHFSEIIQDTEPSELLSLQKAWNDLYLKGKQKGIPVLKKLDIPIEKQNEFLTYLSIKYGSEFSEDSDWPTQVRNKLKLDPKNDGHAVRYGFSAQLSKLLENALKEKLNFPEVKEETSEPNHLTSTGTILRILTPTNKSDVITTNPPDKCTCIHASRNWRSQPSEIPADFVRSIRDTKPTPTKTFDEVTRSSVTPRWP